MIFALILIFHTDSPRTIMEVIEYPTMEACVAAREDVKERIAPISYKDSWQREILTAECIDPRAK